MHHKERDAFAVSFLNNFVSWRCNPCWVNFAKISVRTFASGRCGTMPCSMNRRIMASTFFKSFMEHATSRPFSDIGRDKLAASAAAVVSHSARGFTTLIVQPIQAHLQKVNAISIHEDRAHVFVVGLHGPSGIVSSRNVRLWQQCYRAICVPSSPVA